VAFAVGKDQQHKFHYFFVISLTISFVSWGFRLQLLNTKLKQLSPILPASSFIDDADDGRQDIPVTAVSCENEDENEETECREFIDHQSEIDHEEQCCNSLMALSESEVDKQNEDGDSSVVQASGEETMLGHKIHWEKVCVLM
jgi:hypothetical protein